MKVVLFLFICCLQQMCSNAWMTEFMALDLGPECITLKQIYKATEVLCAQRDNRELWDYIIDCHEDIDETFMRASGEAQCPIPKYIEEPNNTMHSMEDIFYNICGIVDGDWWDFLWTAKCIVFGQSEPYVMTHRFEVSEVKRLFGEDVPCKIGKCVLARAKDLGLEEEVEEEEEEDDGWF